MSRRGVTGSFWPTQKQDALLRLILGVDGQVEDRWRELQPFSLDDLDPGSFCMLPLLHTRLAAAEVEGPYAERIAGTYRSTWYHNQLKLQSLSAVVGALAQQGITPVVFGGASLAPRFYEQVAHRPLPQLDLLIRPEEANAACEVLQRLGSWRVQQNRPAYLRLEDHNHTVLVLHRGLPSEFAGATGAADRRERLVTRTSRVALGGVEVVVLAPGDEIAVACGLGARAKTPPSVQWLLDVVAVLNSGECSPADILSSAAELDQVVAVRETVSYLDHVAELLELDDICAQLREAHPSRRELVVYRLGGHPSRTAQRLARLSRLARRTHDSRGVDGGPAPAK